MKPPVIARVVAILLTIIFAQQACSVPDDPNYRIIDEAIRGMPASNEIEARRWLANRKALEWLDRWDSRTIAFRPECFDRQGDRVPADPVTVGDLVQCLNLGAGTDGGNRTYMECVQLLVEATEGRLRKAAGVMDWVDWPQCGPEWEPEFGTGPLPEYPHELEPDDVAVDDVERALIGSDSVPSWLPVAIVGGVIVVVIGGVLLPQFLPALCALGNDAACPSNPDYAPGQTPQPQTDK